MPSAKNLEEAASRAANSLGPAARVPSAQRLNPLSPTIRAGSSPIPSDASTGTSAGKLQGTEDLTEVDVTQLSREELKAMALALKKETAALKNHITAISGEGNAGPAPPAGVPAGESPRKSGVSFAPAHRNSVLVVEFQRPSVVSQTPDQLK